MTTSAPSSLPPIEYVVALFSPTQQAEFIVRRGDDDDSTLWYVGSADKAVQFATWAAAEEAAAMVRAVPIGDIYRVVVLPNHVGEPVAYEPPPRPWYRRLLDRLGL